MSELKFIETTDETIYTDILEELENGVGEPLYPGDERRIFGDTMAKVIVTVYNTVNDACRQKMLRYARGTVLDALGENRDVIRLDPTYATTTLRFTVTEAVGSNIIIPAGLRVTGDFVHYFLTDTTAVLYAGSLYVDVAATAEEGGTDYNNIDEGEISEIVDVSDVPLLDGVTNLTITEGGGDREEDEPYRERIREAENKLSTAGPAKAYKYWALSANSLVTDAVVESEKETITRTLKTYAGHAFQGGANLLPDTLVVFLSDGSEATAGADYTAEYADVLAACSADDVRPLTDMVTVEAPETHEYDIELTYYTTKANESEVVQNVEGSGGAIDQYINWQGSTLNQDINPDELRKRILCPDWADDLIGATRVQIIKPEYTELNSTTVAKFSGKKTVKHIVRG